MDTIEALVKGLLLFILGTKMEFKFNIDLKFPFNRYGAKRSKAKKKKSSKR